MNSQVSKPSIVQAFESELTQFISEQGGQIRSSEPISGSTPGWSYEVAGPGGMANLIVHQTQRSLASDIPEYRVRLGVSVTGEAASLLRGRGNWTNRFASLGAVVDAGEGVEVFSQATLNWPDLTMLSALLALASVHGAGSIEHSVRNSMTGAVPNLTSLSRWGDIDFERIHYLNAHYGAARRGQRSWRVVCMQGATIELTAVDNNPYWRGGLLVLISIPKARLGINGVAPIEGINFCDWFYGIAPMFGGWCDDGDNLVFVSFFPNSAKNLPHLDSYIIQWARARIQSAEFIVKEAFRSAEAS